jgi:hypothetical protein
VINLGDGQPKKLIDPKLLLFGWEGTPQIEPTKVLDCGEHNTREMTKKMMLIQ